MLISKSSFSICFQLVSAHCVIQLFSSQLFHDGGRYHIETSPLICRANQWTGFYTITVPVMKELNIFSSCKTENFVVTATERLRQRGKNETKSNVNKNMRTHLSCMKKSWRVQLTRREQRNAKNKLRSLILHFWGVWQKKVI